MSGGVDLGSDQANRSIANPMILTSGDPGLTGGGTYTGSSTQPTLEQYENIFGPAARDIKLDSQRHKRHQRWHLPDALKGSNQYLTDRIDGLITDATNSPFTRNILPYVYLENPDQKIKWNVYSFDEGIASRVPYEAAARVLPQSKRSFAGYTVRQGLAIAMEHNFMVSPAGRENFKNQLTQLVGSIQLTNDLDVHVALLSAPSYQKYMNERYYDTTKTTSQCCRQYVDLFGIMQKTPNALDILIEDAKNHLKTWGSAPPTFLLCNGALTAQMTMNPEKTNYLTNGPDGAARLAQGPDLPSYRGLSIIHSRKFSMDAGTAPRDLLRRRVRVAEYYRIPWTADNRNRMYEFYDQSRDTMFRISWDDLMRMSERGGAGRGGGGYDGYDGGYGGGSSGGGGYDSDDDDDDEHKGYHISHDTEFWRTTKRKQKLEYEIGDAENHGIEVFRMITPKAVIEDKDKNETIRTGDTLKMFLTDSPVMRALCHKLGVPDSVFDNPTALHMPPVIEPNNNDANAFVPRQKTIKSLTETIQVPGLSILSHYLIKNNMNENKRKHHKMSETLPFTMDCIQGDLYGFSNLKNVKAKVKEFMETYTKLERVYQKMELIKDVRKICDTNELTFIDGIDEALCRNAFEHQNWDKNAENLGKKFIEMQKQKTVQSENLMPDTEEFIKICRQQLWNHVANNMKEHLNDKNVNHNNLLSNFNHAKQGAPNFFKMFFNDHIHEMGSEMGSYRPLASLPTDIDEGHSYEIQKEPAARVQLNQMKANMCFAIHCQDEEKMLCAPNLHIPRCHPLYRNMGKYCASSMEPEFWLLQHLVGMMPLSSSMCENLLKTCKTEVASEQIASYHKLLLPRHNTNDEYQDACFSSFLMHWFMSEFHPDNPTRTVAKAIINLEESHGVQKFLYALAKCLEGNTTLNKDIQLELEEALEEMAEQCKDETIVPCITAFSKKHYQYVPAFCEENGNHTHEINWTKMPLEQTPEPEMTKNNGNWWDYSKNDWVNMTLHASHVKNPLLTLPATLSAQSFVDTEETEDMSMVRHAQNIYYPQESPHFESAARRMAAMCRSGDPADQDLIIRHVLLVLANRFWKPTTRAMDDGQGMAVKNGSGYYFNGSHLSHGPNTPTIHDYSGGGAIGAQKDLLILRPNIEHEMLGIIMGRGGTQELGATFWGQTELSCYDDSQHGIWGMSYKYHERAMVTNERNLIRVYDVAFDGYNGGMDQKEVDWKSESSMQAFRDATYDRVRPYNGPSMLVMALPHAPGVSQKSWPNPIVFHPEVSGTVSPSPEKDSNPGDVKNHMVFHEQMENKYCTANQRSEYFAYMQKLGMTHWTTVDQNNRPAGDCCINNETSSNLFAFEGTMKIVDKKSGAVLDVVQGSGHLGPSYVGVASVREGRGILNGAQQPTLHRLI